MRISIDCWDDPFEETPSERELASFAAEAIADRIAELEAAYPGQGRERFEAEQWAAEREAML